MTLSAAKVFILTHVRKPELLYGSLLVFKTLRTGWPTATVTVVDNASIPEAASAIEAEAQRVGAHFVRLSETKKHHDFIIHVIETAPEGAVVFSDPDIMYWSSCEDWSFQGLMAGRLIPKFFDTHAGATTYERLHTSLLVIPSVEALRARLATFPTAFQYSGAQPSVTFQNGQWYRWDTLAVAYAAMKEDCQAFTAAELDCFDHVMCGTHLDIVGPALDDEGATLLKDAHNLAQSDFTKLRGIWRRQEAYFKSRGCRPQDATPQDASEPANEAFERVRESWRRYEAATSGAALVGTLLGAGKTVETVGKGEAT